MVTSKALVTHVDSAGKAHMVLEPVELPEPQENHVLVRVKAVAQNPTDDGNAFGELAVLGCDFTGTVEALGSKVSSLKIGDVIAGLIWGGEIKGQGAYSEYVFADEKICFKVSDGTSDKEAATIPLAAATAWLALYSKGCLNIDRNSNEKSPVMVWGGSSSVGLYTIQLAHLFSIPVVTTCSPKHFELCKSLGADWVFDYRDPDVVQKIKSAVPGIQHVFDTIGTATSSPQSSQTISVSHGVFCTVRPGLAHTEDVDKSIHLTDVLVWTAFLKDHQYKEFTWPKSEEDHELSAELFQSIPDWLQSGKLKPNAVHSIDGGLSSVEKGFQMHRDGLISGFKIVYGL